MDPALDHAGRRLADFLDRTIKELKPVEEFKSVRPVYEPLKAGITPVVASTKPKINRFSEVAAKLKANRAIMHAEVDKLDAESDEIMPILLEAVGKHRSELQDMRDGVQDMKDAAEILRNFDPNDESKT